MTAPTTTAPAIIDPFAQPAGLPAGGHIPIPEFEGQEVEFTKAKVTSVSGLEIGDAVLRMDDMVEMRITARVVGIDHKVNSAGKLERVHLIKAIESDLIKSWDAAGRETVY